MEDSQTEKVNNFIQSQTLRVERIHFAVRLISVVAAYIVTNLLLNSIRANAFIGIVWALIALQLLLYFSIFTVSYWRAKVIGLNRSVAFFLFLVLAVLGRVEDWELIIIPLLVVGMLLFSARATRKRLSEKERIEKGKKTGEEFAQKFVAGLRTIGEEDEDKKSFHKWSEQEAQKHADALNNLTDNKKS